MLNHDHDHDNDDTHPAWIIVRDGKYSITDKNDRSRNRSRSNSFYVVFCPILAPIPNFIQIWWNRDSYQSPFSLRLVSAEGWMKKRLNPTSEWVPLAGKNKTKTEEQLLFPASAVGPRRTIPELPLSETRFLQNTESKSSKIFVDFPASSFAIFWIFFVHSAFCR